MLKPMQTRFLASFGALALLAALPAQAQTSPEAFNPLAFMAPIMTPLGAMMVPVNPAQGGFNPAAMMNPAMMANPMALMPAMPGMPSMPSMPSMPAMPNMPAMPGYGAPAGMVPFSGLQVSPQAYGMPAQMNTPFAAASPSLPFSQPFAQPFNQPFALPFSLPGYPAFPGFGLPFAPGR